MPISSCRRGASSLTPFDSQASVGTCCADPCCGHNALSTLIGCRSTHETRPPAPWAVCNMNQAILTHPLAWLFVCVRRADCQGRRPADRCRPSNARCAHPGRGGSTHTPRHYCGKTAMPGPEPTFDFVRRAGILTCAATRVFDAHPTWAWPCKFVCPRGACCRFDHVHVCRPMPRVRPCVRD